MKFPEIYKVVPILASENTGAGVDMDSINMKGYHHATIIITMATIVGDAVLTVNSGASDGTKSSALTFHYAFGTADIGTYTSATAAADVLNADATSAALTITGTAYDDTMLIVEVDASDMDTANDENWLTLNISAAGSSAFMHAVAILEPRYTGNVSGSALA